MYYFYEIAHAKMEKELFVELAKKKTKPPPRPPPPYVEKNSAGNKKSLSDHQGRGSSSPAQRPARLPRYGGIGTAGETTCSPRNSSPSFPRRTSGEDIDHVFSLSDSRQRSKSSTSLVTSFRGDLEKKLAASQTGLPTVAAHTPLGGRPSAPPPIKSKPGTTPRSSLTSTTPLVTPPPRPTTSPSPSAQTALQLRKLTLNTPTPINILNSNSAPSTPIQERAAVTKQVASPRHKPVQQRPLRPSAPIFSATIHPEGNPAGYNKSKLKSPPIVVQQAPTVKLNLTGKGKYTRRPAPPRPALPLPRPVTGGAGLTTTTSGLTTTRNSINVFADEDNYAIPHHVIPNTADSFIIEPYATCHNMEPDMYVEMTSNKTLLDSLEQDRHSPCLIQLLPSAVEEDQIYANADLGPNGPATYASLTVRGTSAQSTSVYADVNTPFNPSQDDNNVYSVPKSNALRCSMSDSSVDGGYISLSLKRDDGKSANALV